jgi:hypothetical protein
MRFRVRPGVPPPGGRADACSIATALADDDGANGAGLIRGAVVSMLRAFDPLPRRFFAPKAAIPHGGLWFKFHPSPPPSVGARSGVKVIAVRMVMALPT